MTPFYFGSGARRLFGLYTAAAAARSARAVVLCAPWGQEYLRAHRSLRQLGNQLAAAGCHVLRFDYFGTGDSAGEFLDASLDGWERDIDSAIDELMDMSDARRVGLVGLRLGATLAAQAAARRRKEVDALLLWDPVVRGAAYADELWGMFGDRGVAQRPPGAWEVDGFPLAGAMAEQIEALDLRPGVATWPARTAVVWSAEPPDEADFMQALQAREPPVTVERLAATPPPWLEDRDLGAGAVPVAVLQRIVHWMTA